MNIMCMALMQNEILTSDENINKTIKTIKTILKKEKIKISEKFTKIGKLKYYKKTLPYVSNMRDVLRKPSKICEVRINWKNKPFTKASMDEILAELPKQWGWVTSIVDSEHTRNNFKNKESVWVIYDTEEEAQRAMEVFNLMFLTAIERDAVEEYKRFKQNPMKRPLTFDKLVSNAYELYEKVDNGEL